MGKLSLCVNISLLLLFPASLWGHAWSFHKPDFQFKEAPDQRSGVGGTETGLWAEVESGKMNFPLEGSQGPRVSGTSHQPEKKWLHVEFVYRGLCSLSSPVEEKDAS